PLWPGLVARPAAALRVADGELAGGPIVILELEGDELGAPKAASNEQRDHATHRVHRSATASTRWCRRCARARPRPGPGRRAASPGARLVGPPLSRRRTPHTARASGLPPRGGPGVPRRAPS